MATIDIILVVVVSILLIFLGIIMGILLAESVYDVNCDTKFNKKETKILMKAYKKNRKVKVNKSKSLSKEEFIRHLDKSGQEYFVVDPTRPRPPRVIEPSRKIDTSKTKDGIQEIPR